MSLQRLLGPGAALGLSLALLASGAQAQTQTLTSLHDALNLSSAQEQAWRDYVRATAPNGRAQARRAEAARMLPSLPTPRRIDLVAAAMEQDLADFRAQGAAVKAFYGQLSAAQQAVFDRQTVALSGARSGQGARPPG